MGTDIRDPHAEKILKGVQFLVDKDGRPCAVQVEMKVWEAILDWLENAEDRALVKEAISRLRSGPKAGNARPWGEIRKEWDEAGPETRQDGS